MTFNSTMALSDDWTGPIRSISRSPQVLAPLCLVPTVFFNLHIRQTLNPLYFIGGASEHRLWFHSVERKKTLTHVNLNCNKYSQLEARN